MAKPRSRRKSGSRGGKRSPQLVGKKPKEGPSVDQEPQKEVIETPPQQTMHPRSIKIMWSLMALLLIFFVLLAWQAPDPTQPKGNPAIQTVTWRLLFLLAPLAIMYGLLWWDKIMKLLGR
jgi:hypothetical protein